MLFARSICAVGEVSVVHKICAKAHKKPEQVWLGLVPFFCRLSKIHDTMMTSLCKCCMPKTVQVSLISLHLCSRISFFFVALKILRGDTKTQNGLKSILHSFSKKSVQSEWAAHFRSMIISLAVRLFCHQFGLSFFVCSFNRS